MWRRANPVEPKPAVLFRINVIQRDHVLKTGSGLRICTSLRRVSWVEQPKLTASDADAGDEIGISDDKIIVGARLYNDSRNESGSGSACMSSLVICTCRRVQSVTAPRAPWPIEADAYTLDPGGFLSFLAQVLEGETRDEENSQWNLIKDLRSCLHRRPGCSRSTLKSYGKQSVD